MNTNNFKDLSVSEVVYLLLITK